MISNPFYLFLTFSDIVDIGSKINDMHGQQQLDFAFFSDELHQLFCNFYAIKPGQIHTHTFLFWKERKFHLLRSTIRKIETHFDWLLGIQNDLVLLCQGYEYIDCKI